MIKTLKIPSLLLFIVFYSVSFCQEKEFNFRQISTEQQLPGVSIQSVFQDQKGLMWFGIESIGLCKYDGKNFTVYERNPDDSTTISNNFPLCFAEDSAGNMWIGTTEGLNKFDRNTNCFTRYLHSDSNKNSICNNFISDLLIDEYNNIWICTRKGVSILNFKTNRFYDILTGTNTSTADIAYSLYYDDNKNIWIGTFTNGLYKITRNNISAFSQNASSIKQIENYLPYDSTLTYGKQSKSITKVIKYDANNLLLGKTDGLYIFNTKTLTTKKHQILKYPELDVSYINTLCKDESGKIWVGHASQGLYMIDLNQNKEYYFDARRKRLNGLRSNSIRGTYQDKEGIVWIATKFQGLYTYDKRQETLKAHKYNTYLSNLSDKYILSILCDSRDNIWIGTKFSGAYVFNQQTLTTKNLIPKENTNSLNSKRVECMTEDILGNIWLGTSKGLSKYNPKTNAFYHYQGFHAKSIVTDKDGNVWVGTNTRGIVFYNRNKDKIDNSPTNNWNILLEREFGARSINITSDTLLWISTFQDGLYQYNLKTHKLNHYKHNPTDSNSISGNMIAGVFIDNLNKVWIGTKANGLNVYNPEHDNFTHIKKKQGLPPNTIYNIIQDNKYNYWMTSHKGLFMINNKNKNYNLLNKTYGLRNDILEINAIGKTKEGLLIFGSSEGLNIFNPELIELNQQNIPILISSIKIYDKIIREDIDKYTELAIDYEDKYISIGFTVTSYANPNKYHYKYKLENYDDEWIENNTSNNATYTGLPPGEYFFKITATTTKGKWTESPLIIKITVDSPFWKKPIFIVICIIFIFLLTFIIYFFRIRFAKQNEIKLKELVEEKTGSLKELNQQLETNKKQLEQKVRERTKDLEIAREKAEKGDELKSAFLANMSHEIRTPLNAVIGLSNILIEKLPDDDEDANLGKMIETNASTLQQLINDIIDISKIEANQITIHKEAFPINTCLSNIGELYQKQIELYSEYMKIEVIVETPPTEIYFNSDQLRIEQILKNLINNAIKFTKEGFIKFGYTLIKNDGKKDTIQFFVKDSGSGIPPEDQKKIFDRFEKNNSRDNVIKGGTGLGLSISYNLVKLLGGTIWVESEINKGATFFINLELEQEEEISLSDLLSTSLKTPEYKWNDKHVLIAEDFDANFIVLEGILRQTNIQVSRVNNGEAVVKAITSGTNKYDIILMDINMPKLNGFEATQQIKAHSPKLPIIAQTAFAMDYEERKILKSGFDGYLSKPINKMKLLNTMANFLK